jgi:hypothetical protein
MRAEVGQSILGGHFVRIRCSPGRNFQLQWRYEDICVAETVANQFNHALAAHDAELDKTRFVELTEQNNKQLRLQLCRVMAAGPGNIDHTVRILEKWRDIENTLVVGPALRNELEIRDARIRVLETELADSRLLAKNFRNLADSWMETYFTLKALTTQKRMG